ncbi:restriction endonuclease subunit S [Flammeovirga sp. MY04]|uniref:restriction endonuclease subunit S n=1 Tax=Flammeovirga sp. MY04 TaxID=1191459 RepID=UPI0008060D79|nr:restriction endonuclease subunit S [Flammeovirga sp. MY04]ANQ51575.1 restriction endonuclease subunit S [Flammeovirga sp. MY04]
MDNKIDFVPEHWEYVTLKEVANINPSKPKLNDDTEVSFIGMADTSEDAKLINAHPKKYNDVKSGFTGFEQNDVLIAKITPCFENGKGAFLNELPTKYGFGSTEFHVIRGSENILSEYIYYHSISYNFRENGKNNMTGSAGQKRVSKQFIENYKIPLPPLPEQKKIASILSTVDQKLEQIDKQITKTQELKKGLSQRLLTRGIGHTKFKQSKIGEVPESWGVVTVDDVSDVQTGGADTQDKIEGGKYPFYVRSNTIERINNYTFEGEAILTSGDGVGVGKIYHYVNGKFNYHQRVYNIHNFTNEYYGQFFYYYFSQHFYARVSKMSAKNSVDSVRRDMITKMPIPLPSIKEQKQIASILSTVDQKLSILEGKKSKVEELKKGLMQGLLSGKVRV